MTDLLIGHLNHVAYVVLLLVGFHAMTTKRNLIKKVVGLNVFQWSIILFIVSLGAKRGATIPIVRGGGPAGHGAGETALAAADYANPLPHVMMLTAIVVGVATTGVALALLLRIHQRYRTTEEDEVLARVRASTR